MRFETGDLRFMQSGEFFCGDRPSGGAGSLQTIPDGSLQPKNQEIVIYLKG
ncbi:hypothetical protein [Mucilaginibacter sp. NFR10]|uniref:hypothetical protein n=1 Tax=Mucilaginibacter sp. NFR10 TaxID=1566292 RepID=UPI0008717181|nr:hypothetical protein [Mucilaginibacter sp. NFR10]SCW68219.1 hypothetical protein SAMN03159284_02949 [Mucilaginibacter sp. NFR10]